jgi:hypothetical protein
MILLASVMVTLELRNIFYTRTWSSNQSGVGAILALSGFLNQIPHQNEPEISGLYLAPHEDNSVQLLSIANIYKGLPYLVSTL